MAPRPPLSIEVLREAVRRAIRHSSLNQVARDIGVSSAGLLKIMEPSKQRPSTLRKLRDWYLRHGADADGASEESIRGTLEWQQDGLVDEDRVEATLAYLGILEGMHRKRGTHPPAWIEKIRAHPLTPPPTGEGEPPAAAPVATARKTGRKSKRSDAAE